MIRWMRSIMLQRAHWYIYIALVGRNCKMKRLFFNHRLALIIGWRDEWLHADAEPRMIYFAHRLHRLTGIFYAALYHKFTRIHSLWLARLLIFKPQINADFHRLLLARWMLWTLRLTTNDIFCTQTARTYMDFLRSAWPRMDTNEHE